MARPERWKEQVEEVQASQKLRASFEVHASSGAEVRCSAGQQPPPVAAAGPWPQTSTDRRFAITHDHSPAKHTEDSWISNPGAAGMLSPSVSCAHSEGPATCDVDDLCVGDASTPAKLAGAALISFHLRCDDHVHVYPEGSLSWVLKAEAAHEPPSMPAMPSSVSPAMTLGANIHSLLAPTTRWHVLKARQPPVAMPPTSGLQVAYWIGLHAESKNAW